MSDIIEKVLKDKKLEEIIPEPPKPPVPAPVEPELTEEKIEKTIELLRDVEGNNGLVAIAQAVDLTANQVAEIQRKMQEKIAELTPAEEIA